MPLNFSACLLHSSLSELASSVPTYSIVSDPIDVKLGKIWSAQLRANVPYSHLIICDQERGWRDIEYSSFWKGTSVGKNIKGLSRTWSSFMKLNKTDK